MRTSFPSAGNAFTWQQMSVQPVGRFRFQPQVRQSALSHDVFFGSRQNTSNSWLKAGLLSLLMLGGAKAATTQGKLNALDKPLNSRSDMSELLKCPPFVPTNHSLFTPSVYSDGPQLQPAPIRAVNETEISNQLSKTFNARFPQDNNAASKALALFNQPDLKSLVPDPRLRGALVSLQGTLAEPAIEVIQNGTFSGIDFADLGKNIIAARRPDPAGLEKPKLLFNSRYADEDFRQLAPYLAHDALHGDQTDSAREERINHALASLVYGQFIAEDPALAQSGTELSRRQNTEFKARLDSRDADGNLRLFESQGNVYPGCDPGKELTNYGAAFTQIGADTPNGTLVDSSPGSEALRRYVELATGLQLDHADFDETTEKNLDAHQAALKPEQLISAAHALQLNTTCEHAPADPSATASKSSAFPDPTAATSGASSRTIQAPGAFRALAMVGKKLIELTWG